MAINIGTTTQQFATANSFQRKLLKASNGTLILFANVDKWVKYKTSTDNGVTWSSWVDVGDMVYDGLAIISFDVYIDTNDDIYVVYYVGRFRKLTYSVGAWLVGSEITIHSFGRNSPVITKRSNGDMWAADFAGSWVFAYYSTDGGATWNASTALTADSISGVKLIAYDTKIWLFADRLGQYPTRCAIDLYEYDSAWSVPTEITPIFTNQAKTSLLKISDTNIWMAGQTASGLRIYNYNGSVWDSGTLISDNALDETPTITNINGSPAVVWRDYNGSQYDIVYRLYNGVSWDAQVNITSDATVDDYPSALEANATINLIWTSGSASPYTIYFEAVTTEEIYDLNNDFRSLKLWSISNISNDIRTVSNIVWSHIVNDFRLTGIDLYDILNDFRFLSSNVLRYDINNLFRSMLEVISDINNKFNTIAEVIENIVNKFSLVKEEANEFRNFVNFFKESIYNISNEIRTQKLIKNNINNDIRFIADWMVAGDAGFQSIGFPYMKIYIDSIEQTDADITNISINRPLNSPATANFKLGRAYDNTKPDMESIVEIKYNDILIYKGYLTGITPTESPESINILCQDMYWKDNKTKKYFFVGHKTTEDNEKYYLNISDSLSTEFNFIPGVGEFIPQTISCFAVGKSDCITTLIGETGNCGWYYSINEYKKLWSGGKGNIIKIERQTLGNNIRLFDVVKHQFTESIDGIANKFRVQMGTKTIRNYNTTGGEAVYLCSYTLPMRFSVTPAWDCSLEVLAKNSITGYGWDYHLDADNDRYKDVFVKYNLVHLGSNEEYSDDYPPEIEVHNSVFSTEGGADYIMTEGFTVDYESGVLLLSEPLYRATKDANTGEIKKIERLMIEVKLRKRVFYLAPGRLENEETDITNPLMFFTEKLGSYPETIYDNLDLSSLSIQLGGQYRNDDREMIVIPSWDDTAFATDYATWKLSQIANKKITGNIDITLDTYVFYQIDLSKRIMIDGVIGEPMNITNITINGFIVTLDLESFLPYKRTVSLQSRGE